MIADSSCHKWQHTDDTTDKNCNNLYGTNGGWYNSYDVILWEIVNIVPDSNVDEKTMVTNLTVQTKSTQSKWRRHSYFNWNVDQSPQSTRDYLHFLLLWGLSLAGAVITYWSSGQMMEWLRGARALGFPPCTLSKRGLQSLLSGRRCITSQRHSK